MLEMVQRIPSFVSGYKEYCQEFYDNNIQTFRRVLMKLGLNQLSIGMRKKSREKLTDTLKAFIIGLLIMINL